MYALRKLLAIAVIATVSSRRATLSQKAKLQVEEKQEAPAQEAPAQEVNQTAEHGRSCAHCGKKEFESENQTNGTGTGASQAPPQGNFIAKIIAAAAQGATAATVAAILSACTEPLVNRLLVKRMTFPEAWAEMTFAATMQFFLTTFPTNMLKFPAFEVINMALSFTTIPQSIRGVVNGFLFCTLMLPVTNYRFRKSMGWEIKPSLLYQAYIPTVTRDIIYGWARGAVSGLISSAVTADTHAMKCIVFGVTIWAACIISSPCNEWRGYTLQPASKALPFFEYFKPVNYARSTGIGATIMGIALSVGMLITPLAEQAVAYLKENLLVSGIMVAVFVAGVAIGNVSSSTGATKV